MADAISAASGCCFICAGIMPFRIILTIRGGVVVVENVVSGDGIGYRGLGRVVKILAVGLDSDLLILELVPVGLSSLFFQDSIRI